MTPARSYKRVFGPAKTASALILAIVAVTGANAASKLTLENPWMRFIIKARPAAGYFTLRNDSDTAAELTGASSPACGMLMLHQSKQANGIDKMAAVKSISVPAHGTISFAPGSYHLMCMKPQDTLKAGASVPVALTFADGTKLTAQFPVKGPGGK